MPFVEGVTLTGWGVVRSDPWGFAGIFNSEAEAKKKAEEMGSDYEVHYGENQKGTDNFIS